MQTGNIGVTTENIFPVIKKFLYSEQEIFIRELISNAIDATQKLKALSTSGNYDGNVEDLDIVVYLNKNENTITFRDKGIGMTGEEIEKYINQIAFSGATDFLEKYKDSAANIIGHFGLGFYSSFMISDTVEIYTKSYKDGAVAQRWVCDGSPSYTLEDTEKDEVGTDIILHVSDEFRPTYLNFQTFVDLATKYSRFSPIKLIVKSDGPKENPDIEVEEDGNASANTFDIDEGRETVITNLEPIWAKNPSEVSKWEYLAFYKEMYPGMEEPLFWIHLNVDYPFNLTGVLYFPAVTANVDVTKNKIYLYSNQVFVTEHVDGILPEYLTLLHGVIDSPDIPLNVSRSYLQSDRNVRQISTYVGKKVSETLIKQLEEDRETYEKNWNAMKVFLHYGILCNANEIYEKLKPCLLFEDVDGKYYTHEEYYELVKDNQTDKDGHVVYLYTQDKKLNSAYIDTCKKMGYNVLYMNDNLSTPFISFLERRYDMKRVFTRVDSNIPSRLIMKDIEPPSNEVDTQFVLKLFNSQRPDIAKDISFMEECSALGADELPGILTLNEYSRRTKEIYASNHNIEKSLGFKNYFTININTDSQIIKDLEATAKKAIGEEYGKLSIEYDKAALELAAIEGEYNAKATEDRTEEDNDKLSAATKVRDEIANKRNALVKAYADTNDIIHEIYDIALVQFGLLYGDRLNTFLKRSVKLITIASDTAKEQEKKPKKTKSKKTKE